MKKTNSVSITLFILLLSACNNGSEKAGGKASVQNTDYTRPYNASLCAQGDSQLSAVEGVTWNGVAGNAQYSDGSEELLFIEDHLLFVSHCDNGLTAEVYVPYTISNGNTLTITQGGQDYESEGNNHCSLEVERASLQFGRIGNKLHLCSSELGNLLYVIQAND